MNTQTTQETKLITAEHMASVFQSVMHLMSAIREVVHPLLENKTYLAWDFACDVHALTRHMSLTSTRQFYMVLTSSCTHTYPKTKEGTSHMLSILHASKDALLFVLNADGFPKQDRWQQTEYCKQIDAEKARELTWRSYTRHNTYRHDRSGHKFVKRYSELTGIEFGFLDDCLEHYNTCTVPSGAEVVFTAPYREATQHAKVMGETTAIMVSDRSGWRNEVSFRKLDEEYPRSGYATCEANLEKLDDKTWKGRFERNKVMFELKPDVCKVGLRYPMIIPTRYNDPGYGRPRMSQYLMLT